MAGILSGFGAASGLWCPVVRRRHRLSSNQFPMFPPRGHWARSWTVHDLESEDPEKPIAVGNIDSIELDEEIFGKVMDVLKASFDLMDVAGREEAKRANWRRPA